MAARATAKGRWSVVRLGIVASDLDPPDNHRGVAIVGQGRALRGAGLVDLQNLGT